MRTIFIMSNELSGFMLGVYELLKWARTSHIWDVKYSSIGLDLKCLGPSLKCVAQNRTGQKIM